MRTKLTTEHVDFSQYPEMRKNDLECVECGKIYRNYRLKHWYEDEMCEECNEEHSTNSCGFCGEDIEDEGHYCSKECSVADNTEGV